MDLTKISLYFALLQQLLHIGTAAVDALHKGHADSPALSHLDTHLTAITGVVDALGANAGTLAGVAVQVQGASQVKVS